MRLTAILAIMLPWSAALAQPMTGGPPPPAPEAYGPEIEDITDLDLEALLASPIVESASKRRQSLEEAPASITVIEGDDLVAAGAVSLSDVLRTVPGAWVYHTQANAFGVGLRGAGRFYGNSVLLLINGRRYFNLSYGFPTWSALPVQVEEIERIEVLRGPGAPLYGADALSGVINIVTKHAKDHSGVEALFSNGVGLLAANPAGSGGKHFNNGGSGSLAANYRRLDGVLSVRGAVGFKMLPEWDDTSGPAEASLFRYGSLHHHGSLTLDWVASRDLQGWVDARYSVAEARISYTGTPPTAVAGWEQTVAAGLEKKHFVFEQLSMRIDGDARRAAEGTRPLGFARITSRVDHYHLVTQADLALWDGADVLTAALEGSYRVDAPDWTDLRAHMAYGAVVLQNEAALFQRRLVVNTAGRFESIDAGTTAGAKVRYANFNPRVSLIVRPAKNHTLRFAGATSYRTPTPFLMFFDLFPDQYPAPIPPAYAVRGNPRLKPERLRAVELGYRGRLAYWLRLEATAFAQQAQGLIETDGARVPFQTHNATNERHLGFELAAKVRPGTNASGYVHYSFLNTRDEESPEKKSFPPHLLSLGASGTAGRLRLRGDFHYVAPCQFPDAILDGEFLTNQLVPIPAQFILNLRLGYKFESPAVELFVAGTNLLSPLRARPNLRQFSDQTSAPIGTVLMIGLALWIP